MKTIFPEKSLSFEKIIREISDTIVNLAQDKISFIILFGSFARGDWIFDRYGEGNITYTYASDYDFLVVTKEKNNKKNGVCEDKLTKKVNDFAYRKYGHNPHFVIEPLDYVNSELEKGRYFFSEIKKEGILLYNSGEFELSEPKVLSHEDVREMAKGDYDHWLGRSEDFLLQFKTLCDVERYDSAAFDLHQAAESLYNCVLLVLTGYKPKSHDLEQLGKLAAAQSNKFLTIFPTATEDQIRCFKLLNKAYIDARYNKNFRITKDQLYYLESRVEILKEFATEVCQSRI